MEGKYSGLLQSLLQGNRQGSEAMLQQSRLQATQESAALEREQRMKELLFGRETGVQEIGARSEEARRTHEAELAADQAALEKLSKSGLRTSDTSGVKAGNLSVSSVPRDPTVVSNNRLEASQTKDLAKRVGDIDKTYANNVRSSGLITRLLDGSALDEGELNTLKASMMLVPGGRMYKSIMDKASSNASLGGDAGKISNYLTNQLNSSMSTEQKNALRENVFKNITQHNISRDKALQEVRDSSPDLYDKVDPAKRERLLNTLGSGQASDIKDLLAQKDAYYAQAGKAQPGVQPISPPNGMPVGQGLRNIGVGIKSGFSQPAPQVPRASLPTASAAQPPAQGLGQLGIGASAPPATKKIIVRHPKTGETLSIDPADAADAAKDGFEAVQ